MTTQVSKAMTDLREQVRHVLVDAFERGREGGGFMVENATDAIMALVQPVMTDEVVKAIEDNPCVGLQWDGDVRVAYCDVDALAEVLTAALPRAMTRDDVIEELAVEAETNLFYDWIKGVFNQAQPKGFADWLRSRKGGA